MSLVNCKQTNTDIADWDTPESEDDTNAGVDSIEGVGFLTIWSLNIFTDQ